MSENKLPGCKTNFSLKAIYIFYNLLITLCQFGCLLDI